jgi:hypothetical protein
LFRRLRSERGIALPLALGIMLSLTVSVTAVVQLSGASTRNASLNLREQDAKVIAEDGFNQAVSVLAVDPTGSGPLSGTVASYANGGSVSWTATRSGNVWTVSSTGTAPNPTGSGTGLVRTTVAADLELTQDVGAWNYVYVKPTSGTCLLLQNSFRMEAPLFVDGNFCLKNSAVYAGSRLYVKGKVELDNLSLIGAADDKVPHVSVKNNAPTTPSGCARPWGSTPVLPCTSTQGVHAEHFDTTVPEMAKPPIDLAALYAEAAPGSTARNHRCYASSKSNLEKLNSKIAESWSTSRAGYGFAGAANKLDNDTQRKVNDAGLGTVDLLPSSAYDCRMFKADGTELGRIAWTPGNPGTLTVSGKIFFDGDILPSSNKYALVNGEGTVYANNKITLQNNTHICGVAACAESWDPNSDPPHLLVLVAGYSGVPAMEVKSEAKYQGGLYAVGGMKVSNGAMVHGPALSNEMEAENGAEFRPWPWFTSVPEGAPSNGASFTTLTLKQGSWRS